MSIDRPIPSIELPAGPRWRLVALLSVMVAAAHFNRLSITVAGAESIIPHEGISPTEMGTIYTAYLFIYTLAMSPGGWFIDRFGPRLALFVVGAGSAIFVTLTGLAGILWTGMTLWLGLLVIRGSMGIVNAPTHPSAARLVGNWVPPGQRCFINGVVTFAATVGMAWTYILFGMLMDHYQWTGACFITAVATLFLALVWGVFARSRPAADTGPAAAGAPAFPLMRLVGQRSLMFLTLSYAAVNYFEYLFFYWAQFYFIQEHHLPDEVSRWYSGILTMTMGLGMLAGGFITDRTRHRIQHRHIMALVPVAGLILSAVMLVAGLFSHAPLVALICFAVATAAVGSSEGAFWTLAVEIGGSRGGLAAGIMNTGGNGVGLIAPVLTPFISGIFGWQAGVGMAGVVCLLGAMCWIFIDPHDRLETDAKPLDGISDHIARANQPPDTRITETR